MIESGYNCPKDKASILESAHRFISELQTAVNNLTAMNESLRRSGGASHGMGVAAPRPSSVSTAPPEASASWPNGVDYRQVFVHGSLPQVISGIDGRFLEVRHSCMFLTHAFLFRTALSTWGKDARSLRWVQLCVQCAVQRVWGCPVHTSLLLWLRVVVFCCKYAFRTSAHVMNTVSAGR